MKAEEFLSGELPGVQLTGDVNSSLRLVCKRFVMCERSRLKDGKHYEDQNKEATWEILQYQPPSA